jgi:hypothetical protein
MGKRCFRGCAYDGDGHERKPAFAARQLPRVTRRELRVDDTATLLGLSCRQVCHLLIHMRTEGPACLVLQKRV